MDRARVLLVTACIALGAADGAAQAGTPSPAEYPPHFILTLAPSDVAAIVRSCEALGAHLHGGKPEGVTGDPATTAYERAMRLYRELGIRIRDIGEDREGPQDAVREALVLSQGVDQQLSIASRHAADAWSREAMELSKALLGSLWSYHADLHRARVAETVERLRSQAREFYASQAAGRGGDGRRVAGERVAGEGVSGEGFAAPSMSLEVRYALILDPQNRARDLVRQSMLRSHAVNVVAIIAQPFDGEAAMLRQKLEMNRDGKSRRTVLQPLRVQGREIVDDGRHLTMYLPDAKRMVVQESPQLLPCDVGFRMQLAERNYRFQIAGNERIAGRDATVVVASPRSSGLDTIRLFIDAEANYLLRLETISGSQRRTLLDTLTIQFPKEVPEATFQIRTVVSVRTDRVPAPSVTATAAFERAQTGTGERIHRQVSLAAVRDQIGFEPSVPRSLPMGFAIQDTQLSANGSVRFFAARITDGLVRAKVYQYRRTSGSPPSFESLVDKSFLDVDDVRLLIVSPMPEEIRMQLLRAFATEVSRKGRRTSIFENSDAEIPAFGRSGRRADADPAVLQSYLMEPDADVWTLDLVPGP
jgi:hypothetical protein